MVLRRTATGWFALAPAKVNLHLRVLGKRDDGYHSVDTLIAPVALYDELSVSVDHQCSRLRLEVVDPLGRPVPAVPSDHRNLVVQALKALREEFGVTDGAKAVLVKRIPSQAGLGGGSSDAAAALTTGARAWGINASNETLSQLGAKLGSDVPAFFAGSAARCFGRGEHFQPVTTPSAPCVLVQPPVGLATADVYRACRPNPDAPTVDALLDALRRGDMRRLAASLYNGLQHAAERLTWRIEHSLDAMRRVGLTAAMMTGSGSACFAIATSERSARRAAAILRAQGIGWTHATQLLAPRT